MSKTSKKTENKRNRTKKKREFIKNDEICKGAHVYEPFEEKVNELFEKNNIDIASANYNLEKAVVRDLKKAVSPSNIRPETDYYSYINERWIKEFDIGTEQGYIVQLDNFRLTQDKVYRELIEIIENYISDPKTRRTPKAKCIKNAYESFKTWNTDEQVKCVAKTFAEYVEALAESDTSLWEKLARPNQVEIVSGACPFVWSINPDDKNPKKYRCYLEPPQVTLLDINIYFDDKYDTEEDKKYKEKYRARYFRYLNELFTFALGENHGFNVRDIYDCEIDMLNAMECTEIKDENPDGYNLVTKEEALTKYGFDWEAFCKPLGFKDAPKDFITSNLNYLLCGTKMLKESWRSPKWKAYWIYIYIRQMTRFNLQGYLIFYDFHGKFLRGQEGKLDDTIKPIFGMGFTFNEFLTREYLSHYKNEKFVDFTRMLSEDLKIVFMRILTRNKWLEPKTKKIALDKLQNIKFQIGELPDNMIEDPLLDYKPDDPWGNVTKLALWRHNKMVELVGKDTVDIPVIDWSQTPPKFISTQTYVVNAMYTPTENSIYVPLGYLQKPFVDLDERGIEYNLAFIGFTIAHELSHSLDDFGSKYNKEGQLEDWWTDSDKAKFRKIQEDIVKQYELYASYDNLDFDAWPSIGEDLADIVGFSICLEYLRDFQQKSNYTLPAQFLSFRTFFTYFAIQSRQKISKKAILAQLKTNPHPLDKYRCNVPLSRSRIFRAIFNVKKGDKMSWKNFNNVWSN